MTLDTEKLTLLLSAIANFSDVIKDRLDGKLDLLAQAADSALLEGKTLAEIQSLIGDDITAALGVLEQEFQAFVARRDNPHEVTAEQVGLGDVPNYAAATDAEALAGEATDKLLTPANLNAFWADKIGTAPETLDTLEELAAALQNNPDIIAAIQSLVGDNAQAIDDINTKNDAQDLAIAANTAAIADLVESLTVAFNDAASNLDGTEPEEGVITLTVGEGEADGFNVYGFSQTEGFGNLNPTEVEDGTVVGLWWTNSGIDNQPQATLQVDGFEYPVAIVTINGQSLRFGLDGGNQADILNAPVVNLPTSGEFVIEIVGALNE